MARSVGGDSLSTARDELDVIGTSNYTTILTFS